MSKSDFRYLYKWEFNKFGLLVKANVLFLPALDQDEALDVLHKFCAHKFAKNEQQRGCKCVVVIIYTEMTSWLSCNHEMSSSIDSCAHSVNDCVKRQEMHQLFNLKCFQLTSKRSTGVLAVGFKARDERIQC